MCFGRVFFGKAETTFTATKHPKNEKTTHAATRYRRFRGSILSNDKSFWLVMYFKKITLIMVLMRKSEHLMKMVWSNPAI